MCRTVYLFAALSVLPSLGSDSPKEYDDVTIQGADLESSWFCVSCLDDGRKPIGWLPHFETYRNGLVSSGMDTPGRGFATGTYQVDTSRKPFHLDVTYKSGNHSWTEKGIYEVKGKTLRIAFRIGGQRPTSFEETGSAYPVTLHTFIRVDQPRLEALK